jgi:all-trans-8'-apo-beta-carotenal 15,15'-oxygenase
MNQPTLNRRDWLRTLAATGVTATGLGATAGAVAATAEQAWRSSFAPFDGGRATAMDTDSIKIEGKLPAALQGTFYRNGPARFVLGQSRLTHWFDGDGMVQAIRFTDGKASHTGRLLQTPRRKEEDAAGRYLYPSFGSVPANAKRPRSADETNVSNISLLAIPKSKELFALWEAGSALSIDPQTLETRGTKVWSPETAGAAFSAHPKTAPDGTVWSFGYTPGSGKVIIYQISSVGQLMRQAVIEVPQANMVHDFAITENKLVFLLQPLVWSQDDWRKNGYFLGAMSWDAKAPLIAAVVSKTDWSVTFMDLPNGGVYHNGNAYEAGGKIHFAYPRIPEILPVSQHFDVVFGATEDASYRAFSSPWTLVELDLATKRATQTETECPSSTVQAHLPECSSMKSTLEPSNFEIFVMARL